MLLHRDLSPWYPSFLSPSGWIAGAPRYARHISNIAGSGAQTALAVNRYIGLRGQHILTEASKPLLMPNNSGWGFIQLSVIEMFREVILACWATSLNWYSGRNFLEIRGVKISYCLSVGGMLDQLTSSWSLFVLMGFLVVDVSLVRLQWLAGYLGLALVFVWGGAQGRGRLISGFREFCSSIGGAFILAVGLGAGLSFYGV